MATTYAILGIVTAWQAAKIGLPVGSTDVDVNSLSQAGRPPIFCPSAKGYEAIVSLLMVAGADPRVVDENGDTTASIARKYGHENIVQILEQPG
jgi:ankyrin repeat protein